MGYVKCYTCENLFKSKVIQAGHGIPSRTNAVLFDIRIIRPQCVGCNYFGRGKIKEFQRKLSIELGPGFFEKILLESNKTVKYTFEDYKNIYEKYKKLNEKNNYVI